MSLERAFLVGKGGRCNAEFCGDPVERRTTAGRPIGRDETSDAMAALGLLCCRNGSTGAAG